MIMRERIHEDLDNPECPRHRNGGNTWITLRGNLRNSIRMKITSINGRDIARDEDAHGN
jgi:hypothetical protein